MNKKKPQATRALHSNTFFEWKIKDTAPYLVGGVALFVTIGLFASIPNESKDELEGGESLREAPLQLNIETSLAEPTPLEIAAESKPKIFEVRSGDSMSILFKRAGIGSTTVHRLAYESEHGEMFADIRPGNHFEFHFDADNNPDRIDYVISPLERYIARQTDSGFETTHDILEPDIIPALSVGKIESSFYLAGLEAGLADNLIMELANIFGWDIDFILDIRKDDQFSVLYEEKFLNGEKLGNGNILAAEFINRGRSYKAVRYEDSNGKVAFYTPEGESMRKAFLRTPLDVFRISSHFNLNRKHPVLNTIRAHKGTDYAAPRGTPIKASGNGRVIYAAAQGGYGNVVKIQHAQSYKTVYAHLDRFARGTKVGRTVEQGDIIGYVGTTGLSTAPHLHYEFHVNGSVRNPITVDLPNGTPVAREEMDRFKTLTKSFLALLNGANTKYASLSSNTTPGS